MNIAILGTRYSPPFFRGGEEHVIHELKKHFEKKEHRVDIFVPEFKKWREIDARSKAGNTTRIPVHNIRFFYNLEFSRKCNVFLAKNRYDIILNTHAHLGYYLNQKPHILVAATSSYGEKQAIKTRSFGKFIEVIARVILGRHADKKVYRKCDYIICVNDHIKEELIKEYKVPKSKAVVIGNGVDCESFYPPQLPDAKGESRGIIINYTGRLVNRKNLNLLLCAGALLKKQSRPFKIRVIGEGEEERHLKNLADSLEINDVVDFIGRKERKELLRLYQSSDIFVLPSRYEGMPLVLLEAQACGLPAVVTDFNGAGSIIRNGENGYVMKSREPEELAERLSILIEKGGLRRKMGKNAREIMVKHYSWDTIAENFLKVFAEVNSKV